MDTLMLNLLLDLPLTPAKTPEVQKLCLSKLEDVRKLVGTSNHSARKLKSKVFYTGIEARQRLPQGMHDRCEDFVFAGGPMPSASDLAGLANHLPLHYKVMRLGTHRVRSGETWDLSVSPDEDWDYLDALEERYVFVQVEHLQLETGARVVVRGNVLAMECGWLERVEPTRCDAPVSAQLFDFGILPTPQSVDRNASLNTGAHGRDGALGDRGRDASPPRLTHSLFGRYLAEALQHHGRGEDGCPGGAGGDGKRGHSGGMCRLADLRFGRLSGFEQNSLRIFSQGGTGYPGGHGGHGGGGGDGGSGLDGFELANGAIPGGPGGAGGPGGNGGDGGDGGSGGISSNIFVQLPRDDVRLVQSLSLPAHGGPGGLGGQGGSTGQTGRCGAGCDSTAGSTASQGLAGKAGRHRKARAGANFFVIPV